MLNLTQTCANLVTSDAKFYKIQWKLNLIILIFDLLWFLDFKKISSATKFLNLCTKFQDKILTGSALTSVVTRPSSDHIWTCLVSSVCDASMSHYRIWEGYVLHVFLTWVDGCDTGSRDLRHTRASHLWMRGFFISKGDWHSSRERGHIRHK